MSRSLPAESQFGFIRTIAIWSALPLLGIIDQLPWLRAMSGVIPGRLMIAYGAVLCLAYPGQGVAWALFGLGLLCDILLSLPLGVNALAFLAMYILFNAQHRMIGGYAQAVFYFVINLALIDLARFIILLVLGVGQPAFWAEIVGLLISTAGFALAAAVLPIHHHWQT